MAKQKEQNENKEGKIKELKIELLKQVMKRKGIKKEIARLLMLTNKSDKAKNK